MANETSPNQFNSTIIPAEAGEALSGGVFVDFTTGYEDLTCSIADDGDKVDGIAVEDMAAGRPVGVAIDGVGLLRVNANSANIAVGDYLKPAADNSGYGIKTTTDRDKYGAVALQSATTDGAIIRVRILPRGERSTA